MTMHSHDLHDLFASPQDDDPWQKDSDSRLRGLEARARILFSLRRWTDALYFGGRGIDDLGY